METLHCNMLWLGGVNSQSGGMVKAKGGGASHQTHGFSSATDN